MRVAPEVFYLPGGEPDPGETPLEALARELDEAEVGRTPRPAAELADLRWISGAEEDVELAPAVRDHVVPLLRGRGLLSC
ncbi:hypothetical protein SAMN06272735_0226 [Streptomyces sp. TLI_55]|uniref:NUDIX domain-containing protein n=1 Tax=Streptomyces sp. TLI_55 TaxID=1938861 RepID=UPI000BCCEF59|nr:NUDIX domain-containing protein [Streptomyces sp. TLI_55]SNX55795.1 hypothetical protein SAMN06272735_0226 [Streptomyces sp. TLI_55]